MTDSQNRFNESYTSAQSEKIERARRKSYLVPAAEDTAERSEVAELVQAALVMLPEGHRQALLAWVGQHPDGLSYRQLGKRLGVTAQTVCNWAKAAREKLECNLRPFQ